jgi:hypothetical protein
MLDLKQVKRGSILTCPAEHIRCWGYSDLATIQLPDAIQLPLSIFNNGLLSAEHYMIVTNVLEVENLDDLKKIEIIHIYSPPSHADNLKCMVRKMNLSEISNNSIGSIELVNPTHDHELCAQRAEEYFNIDKNKRLIYFPSVLDCQTFVKQCTGQVSLTPSQRIVISTVGASLMILNSHNLNYIGLTLLLASGFSLISDFLTDS